MKSRIVFLTREPVAHQLGGSTTCALNLLELLTRQGAAVTMVVSVAFSRSPRLWFRRKVKLPPGVEYVVPGYLRLGGWYFALFSGTAWARLLSRLAVRIPALTPAARLVERRYGDALFANAWDLTVPTEEERRVALREILQVKPSTLIVNYAFWGELFAEPALAGIKRVILMHDVLSARVKSFVDGKTPLDCPAIEEATEMAWLSMADAVLAAQQREAELVGPKITARVLVQPIVFPARVSSPAPDPLRCLLVGANHSPNQVGLAWLLRDVWPLVLAAMPGARLAIAGTLCLSVGEAEAGVVKLGSVDSIELEYARAAVCVVPLRIGSGIKIKLIEALSYGKATVSTSVGIQGLEQWVSGVVDVADDPAAFAAAMVRLLGDPAERRQREAGALELVRDHFNAERTLDDAFAQAVL
jgi:hypothetical protein